MKLIIDIPEEDYIRLRDEGMFGNVTTFKRAVRKGIPLEQEPCDDAISRQAVLDKEVYTETSDGWTGWTVDVNDIKELPPVKPEQKIGHWIKIDDCSNSGYYCSECRKRVVKEGWSDTVKAIKYCPNCGARMEVEEC